MGLKLKLYSAFGSTGTLQCVYGPVPEIDVFKQPGLTRAQLADLKTFEAALLANQRKEKITIHALPKIGAKAFSWSYNFGGGHHLLAVANCKGTTAYFVELTSDPRFASGKYLPALERLLPLAIQA